MEAFIHGFILALGLILPLVPQNVFLFNQGALQPTWRQAMPVVLTAGICDTLLITLAIGGVSVVVFSFSWVQSILYGVGFFMLLYMGWSIWKAEPAKANDMYLQMKRVEDWVSSPITAVVYEYKY